MADYKPEHPLTEEHLQQMNDGLVALASAKKQIDLAKRAGIDVAAQEAAMNDAHSQITRIKQTYFPGR